MVKMEWFHVTIIEKINWFSQMKQNSIDEHKLLTKMSRKIVCIQCVQFVRIIASSTHMKMKRRKVKNLKNVICICLNVFCECRANVGS